jgi:hypothetical protein
MNILHLFNDNLQAKTREKPIPVSLFYLKFHMHSYGVEPGTVHRKAAYDNLSYGTVRHKYYL